MGVNVSDEITTTRTDKQQQLILLPGNTKLECYLRKIVLWSKDQIIFFFIGILFGDDCTRRAHREQNIAILQINLFGSLKPPTTKQSFY